MRFLQLLFLLLLSPSSVRALELDHLANGGGGFFAVCRRALFSFKESPHGINRTFECSPSGACVPCLYSEKNDEKYRCSETGYRIPLKCVDIVVGMKDENGKKSQNSRSAIEVSLSNANPQVMLRDNTSNKHRSLLDDSSTLKDEAQSYITYRSCIPPINEEKLSVIGFEGIILCLLLISGSVVYFRKKQPITMPGAGGGRIQMNTRF